MPYLVRWVQHGATGRGEATLGTQKEVCAYLSREGFIDPIAREAIKTGVFYGEQYSIQVEKVKSTKPCYIVLAESGLLRKVQRPKKGTPILECRNKEVAEKVLSTAKSLRGFQYKLPNYPRPIPNVHVAAELWIGRVETFAIRELTLGDVKRVQQT